MWGTFLSEPLRIVGLVGRCPTNYLMRRMPIRDRVAPLAAGGCPPTASCCIRRDFSRLSICHGQVAYVLLTRAPVAGGDKQACRPAAPRLACVKPVASVHPEPGSNSSLLLSCSSFFRNRMAASRPLDNRSACVRPGLPVVSESTGSFFSSCTTSSIAILSMSYLLSLPGLRRKSSAKLRRIFELAKFFGDFFSNFSTPGGVSIFWGRRGTSVPKSECKVTRFFRIDQIFRRLFSNFFPPGRGRGTEAAGGQEVGRREGNPGENGAAGRNGGDEGSEEGGRGARGAPRANPPYGRAPDREGGEGDIFLNEEGFFDGNVVCCKFAARNFYEYFYYKHIKNENRED